MFTQRRCNPQYTTMALHSQAHTGPPDYPEKPIATYEEFCNEYYEEYYFTGARPNDGRGFIIAHNGERIGFISYSCFHLKPSVAELDIWMNCEANCGQGLGVNAIVSLGEYLSRSIGICELIIAPSVKNARAVKAYQKAGFQKSYKAMRDYLLEEYLLLYGDGDYGIDETALLVKQLAENN